MAGWIWIVIIAYVVIDVVTAAELKNIAVMKGFKNSKYFWFSCLLGLPGWLIVIALPDRGGTATEKPFAEDEIPDI